MDRARASVAGPWPGFLAVVASFRRAGGKAISAAIRRRFVLPSRPLAVPRPLAVRVVPPFRVEGDGRGEGRCDDGGGRRTAARRRTRAVVVRRALERRSRGRRSVGMARRRQRRQEQRRREEDRKRRDAKATEADEKGTRTRAAAAARSIFNRETFFAFAVCLRFQCARRSNSALPPLIG